MSIAIHKLAKDRYRATYRDLSGEGHGPLSAAHDLIAKLHARGLTVKVERQDLPAVTRSCSRSTKRT